MQSIPLNDDTRLHGETWTHLYKLVHVQAWRWFHRYDERIDLSEFLSAGNQALAEALATYRPAETGYAFTTYLWQRLSFRMRDVFKHEYAGFLAYEPGSTTPNATQPWQRHGSPWLSMSTVQDGYTHSLGDRLPASGAWQRQEPYTLVREVLVHLATHTSETEQHALFAGMDDATDIEQAADLGMHPNSFRRLRRQARTRVRAWAEETSFAAAD